MMATLQDRKRARERWRHAGWSGIIAIVLVVLNIVWPADQLGWMSQANLANFKASGEIVFVGANRDPTDPAFPQRREELAKVIRSLKEAGAHSVFLDITFDQASNPESDRALNDALRSFGPRAYIISNLVTGLVAEADYFEQTVPAVKEGIAEVGGRRAFHLSGIVWQMPYVVEQGGTALISAPVVMAGLQPAARDQFPINYGFDLSSIPIGSIEELAESPIETISALYAGKTVVIGNLGPQAEFAIPGKLNAPGAIVHIYAAETLKAGHVGTLSALSILFAGLAILFFAALAHRTHTRRALYVCLILLGPVCFVVTLQLGIRPHFSGLAVLLLAFGSLRLRARWKKQVLLEDLETGLPTFSALEADRSVARTHPTIIVARMHRFEEVRQSLPPELHADYVLRITDRLRAAEPDTRIYLGPVHALAWCVDETDPEWVKDHLEGLRALFASPLQVGDERVDVGITFGVDISTSRDVTRRLANAVAAAERTTETYLPILVAETRTEEELIWNISLQARIDAALEQGEIFLVYQPKIRIDTGEMTGMEALVRWRDPVRGLIPPDCFIKQCEESGRMGHLTRHVLREACRAGADLARRGAAPTIAVNISATLLHERTFVAMVREVIAETGLAPRLLVLEITETYRISDMEMARANLHELAATGLTVSMDDFGVGAASLEALLRLPFSELKIDRIFIDRLGQDPKALGIVRSVLELGHNLRIAVVAEGVEDTATLELLRQVGCPYAQGYGICRPVPLEEAVQFRDKMLKLKSA